MGGLGVSYSQTFPQGGLFYEQNHRHPFRPRRCGAQTTCFLADIADFAAFNAVYAQFFKGEVPARSCFQVAALPLGALVEIECIAVK